LYIVFSNKSVKKFILLSLFIMLPAQAMNMPSWLPFLSVRSSLLDQFYPDVVKAFESYTTLAAILCGGCITTFLYRRYVKTRKGRGLKQKRLKKDKPKAKMKIKRKEAIAVVRKKEMTVIEKREAAAVEKENLRRKERVKAAGERDKRRIIRVAAEKLKQQEVKIAEEKRRRAIVEKTVEQEAEVSFFEQPDLADDFLEVKRNGVHCSQLTHGYVKALFDQSISLRDCINQVNDYSSKDREQLAKISFHEIDAVNEDELRAFEYIANGYKNLAHILNGNFDVVSGYDCIVRMSKEESMALQPEKGAAKEKEEIRQSYLSSIISVVWCLYDCALRMGDAFEQGAFNQENKNLYDFFMRYIIFVNRGHEKLGLLGGNCNHPHAYQRISSHLKGLAKGKNIHQYGIDIRFSENEAARNFLPNKMTHLLFIPYGPEDHKFILKPEDDCMYNFSEIFSHGIGLGRSKYETLFGSSDDEKHQRKERIPRKIISDFGKLMNQASIDKDKRVQYEAEVEALGIQRIVSLGGELGAVEPICSYIKQLKKEYNHTGMRFGREVILSKEELKKLVNCE